MDISQQLRSCEISGLTFMGSRAWGMHQALTNRSIHVESAYRIQQPIATSTGSHFRFWTGKQGECLVQRIANTRAASEIQPDAIVNFWVLPSHMVVLLTDLGRPRSRSD